MSSLHILIRILSIALILLGFLSTRLSGPLLLPFLEASSALGEGCSSGGMRNVAKLRELLPINLQRIFILDSRNYEIK